MTFGPTPTITQSLNGTSTEFPLSEVYTPEDGLALTQGGPSSTDVLNGKKSAPVSLYVRDGNNVTQGASTDANTANTIMGRLTKIRDILLGLIGQQTRASSLSVTIASDENALPVSGNVGVSSLPSIPSGANAIGSVIANAGTNLNTSGLALETGGALASILTKLLATLAVTQSGVWNVSLSGGGNSGWASANHGQRWQ